MAAGVDEPVDFDGTGRAGGQRRGTGELSAVG